MSTRSSRKANESNQFIPLSIPAIGELEKRYVQECLDTGWVSSAGEFVTRFEEAIARHVGRKHAVAVTSGTSALHLALIASDIGPGDEVVVPSLAFIAPANAVSYVGAYPVFVDADAETWQLDTHLLERFLVEECEMKDYLRNRKTGRRVRALMPVHVLGHPFDVDRVQELARRFGILVIEDACEALGSTYKGGAVGSRGEISCLSFNGNKIVTCGGGGMLLTDDIEIAKKARHLSTQSRIDAVHYVHDSIGYNYRLTNIQAALGYGQLETLEGRVAKRRVIAKRYEQALSNLDGVSFFEEAPWAKSNYWLSAVLIDGTRHPERASQLISFLHREQVESRSLWQPLHLSPAYAESQAVGGEVARDLHLNSVCLPSSNQLSETQQDRVVSLVSRFLDKR